MQFNKFAGFSLKLSFIWLFFIQNDIAFLQKIKFPVQTHVNDKVSQEKYCKFNLILFSLERFTHNILTENFTENYNVKFTCIFLYLPLNFSMLISLENSLIKFTIEKSFIGLSTCGTLGPWCFFANFFKRLRKRQPSYLLIETSPRGKCTIELHV